MKSPFDFREILAKLKQFFTFKKLLILIINLFVVILLFLGVRRLFVPPKESRGVKVALKKGSKIALPRKVERVGKQQKAVANKKEEMPLPFAPKTEEGVPVKVYKLQATNFTDELPTVGTVKSIPKLELKFESSGIIANSNVKAGDKVEKGDILASLNPRDVNLEIKWADAKVNSAQAEYKAALKRYEVIRKLYDVGAIIKDRLDQAQAEVDVAKSKIEVSERELDLSRDKLKKLLLKAPQRGVIGQKRKDRGEFVTPNDTIFTLLDPDNIFVEVGIIEKDAFKVKSGQRVKVRVDTYPTRIFFGYIERIFPEVDERTRTVNVRIRVLDPGRLLKPGMFARADIAVFSKRQALVIPSSSVSIQQGAYYAAVVEKGKVSYRPVSVEYITTDYAVIKRGLSKGDLVIVETPGMKRLAPNTGVKIIETEKKLF